MNSALFEVSEVSVVRKIALYANIADSTGCVLR